MGCCASSREKIELVKSFKTPEFVLTQTLVSDEKCVYSLAEKAGLKSIFLDKDDFKVKKQTEPGKYDTVMKIKQSALDMGQDRMELKDKVSDKVFAVVRRAVLGVGDCFYIYTVEPPYAGAKTNKWNEELDGQKLYTFGFLQKDWGWSYSLSVYYPDPEKGPSDDGKDLYKKKYKLVAPGWFTADTTIQAYDDDGNVTNENEAVAYSSRDMWQWDFANAYGVEVAPGVDGALMVIALAMLDEIKEDQKHN